VANDQRCEDSHWNVRYYLGGVYGTVGAFRRADAGPKTYSECKALCEQSPECTHFAHWPANRNTAASGKDDCRLSASCPRLANLHSGYYNTVYRCSFDTSPSTAPESKHMFTTFHVFIVISLAVIFGCTVCCHIRKRNRSAQHGSPAAARAPNNGVAATIELPQVSSGSNSVVVVATQVEAVATGEPTIVAGFEVAQSDGDGPPPYAVAVGTPISDCVV